MDYYNNFPAKNCREEINSVVSFAVCMGFLVFLLMNTYGWCRDPLREELQKLVRELESENDALVDKVEDLKGESNDLSVRLGLANESLQDLQRTLELANRTDDQIMDTQG